jgi:hypothetical protein
MQWTNRMKQRPVMHAMQCAKCQVPCESAMECSCLCKMLPIRYWVCFLVCDGT